MALHKTYQKQYLTTLDAQPDRMPRHGPEQATILIGNFWGGEVQILASKPTSHCLHVHCPDSPPSSASHSHPNHPLFKPKMVLYVELIDCQSLKECICNKQTVKNCWMTCSLASHRQHTKAFTRLCLKEYFRSNIFCKSPQQAWVSSLEDLPPDLLIRECEIDPLRMIVVTVRE